MELSLGTHIEVDRLPGQVCGQFGFINTLKTAGRPSSPPAPSSDSDHYDADKSSVSSNKDGDDYGWFCMSIEPPSNKSPSRINKSKPLPHHEIRRSSNWRVKSAKPIEYKYGTSAPQHVLHQPSTQQMTGTPGTQWKEIDTVADTLKKLSLLTGLRSFLSDYLYRIIFQKLE